MLSSWSPLMPSRTAQFFIENLARKSPEKISQGPNHLPKTLKRSKTRAFFGVGFSGDSDGRPSRAVETVTK